MSATVLTTFYHAVATLIHTAALTNPAAWAAAVELSPTPPHLHAAMGPQPQPQTNQALLTNTGNTVHASGGGMLNSMQGAPSTSASLRSRTSYTPPCVPNMLLPPSPQQLLVLVGGDASMLRVAAAGAARSGYDR